MVMLKMHDFVVTNATRDVPRSPSKHPVVFNTSTHSTIPTAQSNNAVI